MLGFIFILLPIGAIRCGGAGGALEGGRRGASGGGGPSDGAFGEIGPCEKGDCCCGGAPPLPNGDGVGIGRWFGNIVDIEI